ncbi:MAG: mechanosensitive ion channel family protein [Cyanothece sp. SIO1E1]|nr:mechanosensitive ion channel family protein [Cyanothece sp. SIO1E1]
MMKNQLRLCIVLAIASFIFVKTISPVYSLPALSIFAVDDWVLTANVTFSPIANTQNDLLSAPSLIQIFQDWLNDLNHDSQSLLFSILCAAIFSLIFFLLIALLNRIYRRALKRLHRWQEEHAASFKIQNLELISEDRIARVVAKVFQLIRFIAVLCLTYLYITLILNLFPWTQKIAVSLINYVFTGVKFITAEFIDYLPHLLALIFIILITSYIKKLLKLIFTGLARGTIAFPGFYREWADPTYKLLLFLLIVLAITIAYPHLPGFDTPAFQGITLFGAILGALGARESVSDVIAGIVLLYTRAFLVGDRIQVNDVKGIVLAKTLLVTRINTPKNVVVTIPNNTLRNSNIINYSAANRDAQSPLVLHTTITLGYDVPWRKVHQVLLNAAHSTSHILKTPDAFVLQTSLDDFSVAYELNAYTDQPGIMERVYSELYQNIQDQCQAAGIEILSPRYLAVRSGNQITIPVDDLA